MPHPLDGIGKVVISIDVEDWPQSTWDHSLEITARSQQNTERLLDLLSEHGQRVTMFVLGKFAERFPSTVKRIASEGHEVASHGYGHIEIFHQTEEEFRKDAQRSKYLLEDILGQPVLGYRAPDFSIVTATTWALDVLAELGFQYDSSIFPIRQRRYGIGYWPTYPVQVRLPSGRSILELPIATLVLFGRRWPVGGGGYHRLLPLNVIRWAIFRCIRQGRPFMGYCHPYEFDVSEFNSLPLNIPMRTRLHQGIGRPGFKAKFLDILKTFKVTQAREIALHSRWPDYAI